MSREDALLELEMAWRSCRAEPGFVRELRQCLENHAGRPTPLTRADHLADRLGGGLRLYLKREDLAHTGTHEINSCLGQALLARRMGKSRLVTGAGEGRHGLAAASAAALLGLRCVIYAGEELAPDRELDASRLRLMGAEVAPVTAGASSPEAADLAARRDWLESQRDTYYLPSAFPADPPYPSIVRDLQSVIGHEARTQFFEAEGRMPDAIVGWVSGGSTSIGLFQAFLDDREVRMFGVGSPDADGAADHRHASATLDDPGHPPGRVLRAQADDDEARAASRLLAATEGILPALESARALAFVARRGPAGEIGRMVLVGLSGRGDEEVVRAASGGTRAEREARRE